MGIVILLLLLMLVMLAIFLIRIPIIIAKARGVGGDNLEVIAILSWCGLFFGITWIIALILALVYQSQVNITNTANGQVVYLSRNNEEHLTAYNRNVQTPILSNLDKLEKLANLKDKGLITQEEFEEQKKELLHPIQSQSEEQNVKQEDKGLKKLKEQNIPEKLKILSEKGVEKLKEQNIPEKLKILLEKSVEKLKEQNIPEKLKILSEKGVEKLKEQNIPEKLKILSKKGVEKLKEQNIPEKLKILSEKGVEKLKEQNTPEKLKILSEKGVEKLKEQNTPEKLNKLKDKGLITQEEFETQKQKLMNNTSQITQNNSYASK